jgi:hypothetical protein
MRFIYLEQDAPAYMIGGICQEDEPYYALGAISRYNNDHDRTIEGFDRVNAEGLMIYSLPLTYVSLKLFGNNYWGFRLPVAVIGILIILLIYDVLRRLKLPYEVIALALLYMLTDFYFFLFCRFQTPQIYSILGITLALWIYFKYGLDTAKAFFLSGFFVAFAIFFIYIYNIFLLLAFGLLIIRQTYIQRSARPLLFFGIGSLSCLLLYVISLYAIGSSVPETLKILTTHGGGIDKEIANESSGGIVNLIKRIYAALIQLPVTNLFRYNLAILFLLIFTLPFTWIKGFKDKSERHLLYFFLLGGIIIQSALVMSYPFKKLVIVFPIVVIMLADILPGLSTYYSQLNKTKRIALILVAVFSLGLCLINFRLNNSEAYWAGLNYGYYENTSKVFNALDLLVLGLVSGTFMFSLFYTGKIQKFIFPIVSCFGIILITKYCFMEKTFYSKEGFTKIAPLLEKKGIIRSACYASQFYTESKPALGCYADVMLYGPRYDLISDSLFNSGKAEFTLLKLMPSEMNKAPDTTRFLLAAEIPMKYYIFRLYRYKKP